MDTFVWPRVSLLVAMRNEEKRITACLRSIAAQDYPADRLEVLVFDGGSTDRSAELAREELKRLPHAELYPNPGIIQSAAWNLGIARSTGEVVTIVSAHAELAPDYVRTAVETLERTKADMVGGPWRAWGETPLAQAIATAMSSPFGAGDAKFHYLDREEEVDTVYMGFCRRELYAEVGGFDETLVKAQDGELSFRLRKRGKRIVCNPAIRSTYRNRSTLRSLAKQYFLYGYWKVRLLLKHPLQMRPRQFAPVSLVVATTGLAVVAFFWRPALWAFLGLAGAYTAADLAASLAAAARAGWRHLPVLPLIYPAMHFAYGIGFAIGLLVQPWKARAKSGLPNAGGGPGGGAI
jgi:cellulose synthase/poly-beta-1,6-N-acetylglucosamine synthase-like glycosyltransferase